MTGPVPRYCFSGLSHEHSVEVVQRMWRVVVQHRMTGMRMAEQSDFYGSLRDYVGTVRTAEADLLAEVRDMDVLLNRMRGAEVYALSSAVLGAVYSGLPSDDVRQIGEALAVNDPTGAFQMIYTVLADCMRPHEDRMAAFDRALR